MAARLDTPVEVNYYKNGGTAKRADGVEKAGAGGVICAASCMRDIEPLCAVELIVGRLHSGDENELKPKIDNSYDER